MQCPPSHGSACAATAGHDAEEEDALHALILEDLGVLKAPKPAFTWHISGES